ncbi:hypothetical protein IFM58399_06205 [Aspergillus lentulus]|uniref:uncharacterized protein n=1 Tax=Aspergillus lentulus TaxID=293939 RepID=UPI001394BA2E|nr:uncharacterized protein IFM58399_06205 [Aspergillus lentulus]GFF41266.1 hypothetical protein IFM58399_06205 [Aspergillus lentulus]GFF57221.1 hypothetical protein IFM62136_03356 [Aspergillus lentulus]GFG11705.1 hypothetical protein IFM61392_07034 [Aspergillus lentulus]
MRRGGLTSERLVHLTLPTLVPLSIMPGTVRRPSWLKTIVRTGGTASNSPMSLKRTPFFENRPPLANSSCIVAGPVSDRACCLNHLRHTAAKRKLII